MCKEQDYEMANGFWRSLNYSRWLVASFTARQEVFGHIVNTFYYQSFEEMFKIIYDEYKYLKYHPVREAEMCLCRRQADVAINSNDLGLPENDILGLYASLDVARVDNTDPFASGIGLDIETLSKNMTSDAIKIFSEGIRKGPRSGKIARRVRMPCKILESQLAYCGEIGFNSDNTADDYPHFDPVEQILEQTNRHREIIASQGLTTGDQSALSSIIAWWQEFGCGKFPTRQQLITFAKSRKRSLKYKQTGILTRIQDLDPQTVEVLSTMQFR